MQELLFQVFRIQVFFPPVPPLLAGLSETKDDPVATLRSAIESRPERESRAGIEWHIGNVEAVDTDAIYFALGRTTRSTMELYDDEGGNFSEMKYRVAPYTHVLLDVPMEICCIAHKSKLAQRTSGIARQLELLLNASTIAGVTRARFEVSEIADPEDFLQRIKAAEAVTDFTVKFRLPNAWDAESDFIKPRQRTVAALRATKGKTEFTGKDLDKEILEELVRSTAATGDDASAKIEEGKKPKKRDKKRKNKDSGVRIHLHGNNVLFRSDEPISREERIEALEQMRTLYRRVRGNES